jgi:hypothetical protein
MVNANIDIFEMSDEESVSSIKCLENLEKIRRTTNGPDPATLPVVNKKGFILPVNNVGKPSKNHKGSNMWCHYCDKNNHNMTACRGMAKFKQQKRTRLASKPKLNPERSLWPFLFFLKISIHSKVSETEA